ncbi:MAG: class I SAM-dependent methyltransferase [Bacteroidota bacterium]
MDILSQSLGYMRYRLRSSTRYAIHSPFVFELVTRVFNDRSAYPPYKKTEGLRSALLRDTRIIHVTDLGAGSRMNKGSQRAVKEICRSAEKSSKYGQLLFRLVNYLKPQTIIDLGTSLGITTLYLSAGSPRARLHTIEGCPQTAAIAQANFHSQGADHIVLHTGNFDDRLPELLRKEERIDFAFFDGNHRKDPTLRYFELCLQRAHNASVFVFDDINWSAEMQQAWRLIKAHPRVTISIDLFSMGMVFFRKEQASQHFVIRF